MRLCNSLQRLKYMQKVYFTHVTQWMETLITLCFGCDLKHAKWDSLYAVAFMDSSVIGIYRYFHTCTEHFIPLVAVFDKFIEIYHSHDKH